MSDFDYMSYGEPAQEPQAAQPDLSAYDKRLSDIESFQQQQLAQQSQQPQPQQGGYTEAQLQQAIQQDPYAQYVTKTAIQQAQNVANQVAAKVQVDSLIQSYKQQNPHLVPFETEITNRANQLAWEATQKGQAGPAQQYIEQSIKEFNTKLQTASGNQNVRLNAMRFDMGQSPDNSPSTGVLSAERLEAAKNDPAAMKSLTSEYYRQQGVYQQRY